MNEDNDIKTGSDEKIVRETDRAFIVELPDGKKIFRCKICNKDFDSVGSFASHTRTCGKKEKDISIEKEQSDTQPMNRVETMTDIRKEDYRISYRLGVDDEMLADMVDELYDQLKVTPGSKGYNDKIEWICRWFIKNKLAQENPQKLYEVISKTFKSMEDEAINFVVDNVFSIKQSYMKERRGYKGGYSIFRPPQPQFHGSIEPMMPIMEGMENTTTWILYQMWQDMKNLLEQKEREKTDISQIKEIIEAEIERKYLRDEVNRLREQINVLIESGGKQHVSPEGWRDDYARLMAEMGGRLLDLGEKLIIENKKTRQMIIKYIAPRFLEKRGVEGKETEGHEVISEGETDEEIIKELEKEGYAE